jgi:outer membrane protein OmpA-like peptidoglycan-associated protein
MLSRQSFFKALFIILFLFPGSISIAQTINVEKVVNIGQPINSSSADFAPSFTADGKTLVFNSKRGSSAYQHIYICYFKDGEWSSPVLIQEIASQYDDESPFITPDGEFIFFSSNRDGSMEMRKDTSGTIRVSFDLYVSKKVNGRWDSPIPIPGQVNTTSHERTPSLSIDSTTLFYTSMPFGDVSRARIMKADYSNGDFINPIVLPAPVNIGEQETGLVPSTDGKGFFFSSRRPGGYGGWDLWYVKYQDGTFGQPVNLGPEINSSKNEINLSVIKEYIYFCSDRDGGLGSYDIYTSKIAVTDDSIKIIVQDKKTKKPVQTEMKISAKVKETEEGATITYEIKKQTDSKGEAIIKHKPQVKDMDVVINEEGYLPLLETLDIPSLKGNPQILELVPIEKEASFDIHSIYFDFESAVLKPESFPYLDALTEYLKQYQTMKFEIIGHTDLHGTDEFNDKLSLERANSVKQYLIGKGLTGDRFTIRGAGKRQPISPKLGPGFDEKNRRTEFKLIEK